VENYYQVTSWSINDEPWFLRFFAHFTHLKHSGCSGSPLIRTNTPLQQSTLDHHWRWCKQQKVYNVIPSYPNKVLFLSLLTVTDSRRWTHQINDNSYAICQLLRVMCANGSRLGRMTIDLRNQHAAYFARHVLRLLSLVLWRIKDWSFYWPHTTWHWFTTTNTACMCQQWKHHSIFTFVRSNVIVSISLPVCHNYPNRV